LVISPVGSGATFGFSCGTLPTNALCLFSPANETLNAGVQGNVAVEIATGNGSSALFEKSGIARPDASTQHAGKVGATGFLRSLPVACGVLLFSLAIRKRRRLLMLASLGICLLCGVSSCTSSGGGTGSTGGNGGGSNTPSGTYTIPVTVTSMGVSRSVNLTLTVD
jgi:hypothetical protein